LIVVGLGVVLLGILLNQFFQNQPDSRFPSGRFPACCFCYFTVLVGTGFLYQGVVSSGWLHSGKTGITIVVAIGLSLLTAILGDLLLFHPDISLRLPFPAPALSLHGWAGRMVLFPFLLIFLLFSAISWFDVLGNPDSARRSKKKPRA
jgi:hypothetical protein